MRDSHPRRDRIYRVLHVAKFEEAIYVLHCFQKKTQVTSQQDKTIAAVRYRAVVNVRQEKMKIDTEIRHVTKPGANLFLELGFPPDEAKRLQAASRRQINDTRLLNQKPKASPSDAGSSRRCGLKPAPR